MLTLEHFDSFVHSEDFIPEGCSLKTTASYLLTVSYLLLISTFNVKIYILQDLTFRVEVRGNFIPSPY